VGNKAGKGKKERPREGTGVEIPRAIRGGWRCAKRRREGKGGGEELKMNQKKSANESKASNCNLVVPQTN